MREKPDPVGFVMVAGAVAVCIMILLYLASIIQ